MPGGNVGLSELMMMGAVVPERQDVFDTRLEPLAKAAVDLQYQSKI